MAQTKPPEWALRAAKRMFLRFVYGTERQDCVIEPADQRTILTAARTIEREHKRG